MKKRKISSVLSVVHQRMFKCRSWWRTGIGRIWKKSGAGHWLWASLNHQAPHSSLVSGVYNMAKRVRMWFQVWVNTWKWISTFWSNWKGLNPFQTHLGQHKKSISLMCSCFETSAACKIATDVATPYYLSRSKLELIKRQNPPSTHNLVMALASQLLIHFC